MNVLTTGAAGVLAMFSLSTIRAISGRRLGSSLAG